MSKNINGGRVKISYFNFVTYLFLNQVAFAKLAGRTSAKCFVVIFLTNDIIAFLKLLYLEGIAYND